MSKDKIVTAEQMYDIYIDGVKPHKYSVYEGLNSDNKIRWTKLAEFINFDKVFGFDEVIKGLKKGESYERYERVNRNADDKYVDLGLVPVDKAGMMTENWFEMLDNGDNDNHNVGFDEVIKGVKKGKKYARFAPLLVETHNRYPNTDLTPVSAADMMAEDWYEKW